MEGAGRVEGDPKRNGGKGSLSHLAANSAEHKNLKDKDGKWVARDDVSIWYLGRKGKLAPGFGAKKSLIGPELGFGHVIGDAFDEPVLIIKTAWGGKSLQKDFRPPSSGGEVGPFYTEMLKHVRDVLDDLQNLFPDIAGDGYEIAGFAWHQGWNDGCSMPACLEYGENLANLIRDVRKDLGVEKLPFVIADSGFGGIEPEGRPTAKDPCGPGSARKVCRVQRQRPLRANRGVLPPSGRITIAPGLPLEWQRRNLLLDWHIDG